MENSLLYFRFIHCILRMILGWNRGGMLLDAIMWGVEYWICSGVRCFAEGRGSFGAETRFFIRGRECYCISTPSRMRVGRARTRQGIESWRGTWRAGRRTMQRGVPSLFGLSLVNKSSDTILTKIILLAWGGGWEAVGFSFYSHRKMGVCDGRT